MFTGTREYENLLDAKIDLLKDIFLDYPEKFEKAARWALEASSSDIDDYNYGGVCGLRDILDNYEMLEYDPRQS